MAMDAELQIEDCLNAHCPWSGKPVSPDALMRYRGVVIGFCNPGCRDKFEKAVAIFDPLVDGDGRLPKKRSGSC